jgi:hypothetical protein
MTSNVVGNPRPDAWVDKTPIKVLNCDQVVMFEADKISDMDDFTKKEKAFFTMSAYMINMFEKKDAGKLTESINLSHIKTLPSILPGALHCLHFQDSFTFREITICLKSEDSVNQIETAFQNFMKCRLGNDLRQPDPQILNNILEASCKGNKNTKGVKYDAEKIKKSIAEELRLSGFSVTELTAAGEGDMGFKDTSKPGDANAPRARKTANLRVPGTPLPAKKVDRNYDPNRVELPPIY